MPPKPKMAPANPLPAHKALRNLEKAHCAKIAELDSAYERIAELEKQLEKAKKCLTK